MFKAAAIFTVLATCFFSTAANTAQDPKVMLSKSNTLVFDSEFTDVSVANAVLEARELNKKLPKGDPIYLVINSPGGSIEAGLELIDNLNALGRTINTVSLFSASMGFQTVQGINGTRYLTPTGTLMSHKAKGQFQGEFPGQIDSRYQYYLRRIGKLDEQTVARSRGLLTMQSYRDLYENEYWCEGQDCVDHGLADEAVLVGCDSSLDGTFEKNMTVEFMGMRIDVAVTKAACPTITAILEAHVKNQNEEFDYRNLDEITRRFNVSVAQAVELKSLIEKKIAEVSRHK